MPPLRADFRPEESLRYPTGTRYDYVMDELTKQSMDALREQISANDRRYTEHTKNAEAALATFFASLDKRLEGMNEFRAALSDQAAGMMTRREAEGNRNSLYDKIEAQRIQLESRLSNTLAPVISKLDDISRPNWALMVSLVSMFLVIAAGVWLVIGLQITAAVGPIQLVSEQNKIEIRTNETKVGQLEESTRGFAQAATDLSHLRADYALIVERLGAMRTENARQNAALVEIETQFCAADIMRNLTHATDIRLISLLWQKSFMLDQLKLPTDNAYYPMICNRNTKGSAGAN